MTPALVAQKLSRSRYPEAERQYLVKAPCGWVAGVFYKQQENKRWYFHVTDPGSIISEATDFRYTDVLARTTTIYWIKEE